MSAELSSALHLTQNLTSGTPCHLSSLGNTELPGFLVLNASLREEGNHMNIKLLFLDLVLALSCPSL